MTTIAFDGRFLASDGRELYSDMIVSDRTKKVFFLEKKRMYVAVAGASRYVSEILLAIESDDASHLPDDLDCDILVIGEDLIPLLGETLSDLTPVAFPIAIGSGAQVAIGAMLHGANAIEAISYAAKIDPGSGGSTFAVDLPKAFAESKENIPV